MINLRDPEKYQYEYWYYTGQSAEKVEKLQESNPDVCVGVASNISYFTSKSGNPCMRYNVTLKDGKVLDGRIKVLLGDKSYYMCYEGSFVFFYIPQNPVFLEIIQVVK